LKDKKEQKSKILEILELNSNKENTWRFLLQVSDNYIRDIKIDDKKNY